ncbi:DUF6056 family protein [Mesobacillus jeotgali]|uniref:DUF6056 family protein n=1 Tax=Mesobacillus jeotgali TaxID=129985 RepID=UPI0009A5C21F|nr:DUF6056 family protein [Mesobacillus jeotgali]
MKTSVFRENKGFISIFSIAVFLLYFYLAYNTPLTHDDWTWGSSDGWARLKNWFENYNGRYLGNLFELYLTRVEWPRFFIMAVFSTLIVILAGSMLKTPSVFGYLLSLLLFLCVPVNIISQTYAWVAGFSNYITSIAFVLMYLVLIKNIFEDAPPQYKSWLTVFVIPLGIMTQLFVEHITIYAVVMAFFVILFCFLRFRKVYAVHVSYLISTIIGAGIMFTNGAYSKILTGADTYRSIKPEESSVGEEVGFFQRIFDVYSEQIYPMLFLNNVILNLVLSLFCIILLIKSEKALKGLKTILLYVLSIYPFYKIFIVTYLRISFFKLDTHIFESIFSLVFYISIILTVLLYITDKNLKYKICFYLLSVLVLAGPLVFVHPFGPRNFIAPYAFFVLAAIEMGLYIIRDKYFNLAALNKVFTILVLALSISYIYVFTMNGSVDRERMAYIKEKVAVGEEEIILTRLPYEQYLWLSTPIIDGYQYETFKEYHGIPEEIKFKVIPYSEWEKLRQ